MANVGKHQSSDENENRTERLYFLLADIHGIDQDWKPVLAYHILKRQFREAILF